MLHQAALKIAWRWRCTEVEGMEGGKGRREGEGGKGCREDVGGGREGVGKEKELEESY